MKSKLQAFSPDDDVFTKITSRPLTWVVITRRANHKWIDVSWASSRELAVKSLRTQKRYISEMMRLNDAVEPFEIKITPVMLRFPVGNKS